jgi:hypothetical protein
MQPNWFTFYFHHTASLSLSLAPTMLLQRGAHTITGLSVLFVIVIR